MANFFSDLYSLFSSEYLQWLKAILDIVIVSFIIYRFLTLIKGTRAVQLVRGLIFLLIIYYIVSNYLKLNTITWIMQNAATLIFVAIPIVFQPEMRRFLAYIGQERILRDSFFTKGSDLFSFTKLLSSTMKSLSQKKVGALIVIERNTGLNEFIETGIKIDAIVSSELLETIFHMDTALHDGAIIIRNDRVLAASVLLPLSKSLKTMRGMQYLGTRHRAALGLSETTDAVCIIASEETGDISVALEGKLYRHLNEDSLNKLLLDTYQTDSDKSSKQKDLGQIFRDSNILRYFFKSKPENESDENENLPKKKSIWHKITENPKINNFLNSKNLNIKVITFVITIILWLLVGNEEIKEKVNNRITNQQTFIVPIQVRNNIINLDKGTSIAIDIKPSHVKVVASKSVNRFQDIKPNSIKVFVNLNKFASTQKLPLSISEPANVTIKDIKPDHVIVNMIKK